MGKILTRTLKNKALEIHKVFGSKLGQNFEDNKQFVRTLGLPYSKKIQNVMAGFLTRHKKKLAKIQ